MAGWDRTAANAVVRLNAVWFATLAQENPRELSTEMARLKALGRHKRLAILTQHPEMAGLLATTDTPELIAESLASARDTYTRLAVLYVYHAAPIDALALAKALKNNSDIIVQLSKRGLNGSETLFILKRDERFQEATLAYERWLRDIFMEQHTDEELASLVQLVQTYGPEIRQRLMQRVDFREQLSESWQKLVRVVTINNHTFDLYLDDVRIWDILELPAGERLLREWGLLPIDLLYGYPELHHDPYPANLHNKVIGVLLAGNNPTLHSLIKLRDQPPDFSVP